MKHREIHLNMRKSFVTAGVTEHWHWLPREVVEILKICLDTILCICCRWTCFSRGLDYVISRGLFQLQSFHDPVILTGVFPYYLGSFHCLYMSHFPSSLRLQLLLMIAISLSSDLNWLWGLLLLDHNVCSKYLGQSSQLAAATSATLATNAK